MIARLPPLAAGAVALIAGAAIALAAAPAARDPLLPLATAAACAILLLSFRHSEGGDAYGRPLAGAAPRASQMYPPRRAVPLLLAWLLLGWAAAAASGAIDAHDCRRGLPDGAKLRFRGQLATAPLTDGTARLRLESIGAGRTCTGTVRARLPADQSELLPGAAVTGTGRWWRSDLDPARVAAQHAGTLMVQSLEVAGAGAQRHPLLALRGDAQRRIRALFGEHAAVVEALLLARKEGLEPELREQFAAAGIAHLLAISGFHVGLLAAGLLALALAMGLSPAGAGVVAGLTSGAYVLFIGAPASAVRAVLMLVLFLAARLSGRPAHPYAVLGAAAIALWLVDPTLAADPGFQLSFAGVTGLFAFSRPLERMLPRWLPHTLRSGIAASIAASASTAPFTALHFQQVAVAGIVSNLVAVPLTAAAVPALAGALVLAELWMPLGRFVAGGAALLLDALILTARAFAAIPGGSLAVTQDSALALLLMLVAVVAIVRTLPARLTPHSRSARGVGPGARRATAGGAAIVVLVAFPLLGSGGPPSVEIHMIDVGQGDAIAIRSPAGRWLLVDAGPASERFDAGKRRVVPYLLRNGVRRLEALILTHPDADHIGGAGAVIEVMRPGMVLDPGSAWGKPMHRALLAGTVGGERRWYAAHAGRTLVMDGMTLEFLHPDAAFLDDAPEANDASVVVRLRYAEHVALLMGDAHALVERALVREHGDALRASVLKVGHHGSRTSSTVELLNAVQADIAIVSAGRRNRFGHPHGEIVARIERTGARLLRTDRDGDIIVTLRSGRAPATRTTRRGTRNEQEDPRADSRARTAAGATRRRAGAGLQRRSRRAPRPLAARNRWATVGYARTRGRSYDRRHHRRAS